MLLLSTSNSPRFRFTLLSDLLGQRVLGTDPEGWSDLGVHIARDPQAHGLTTEYTVKLGFVKDGRAYLRRAYDAAGIEANVLLIVEQLDPNTFQWLPYYRGRVNLSAAKFTTLRCQANVENADFTQKFLNRATVAVDLWGNTSVGGSIGPSATPVAVMLHSRAVIKSFNGSVLVDSPTPYGTLFGTDPDEDELSQTFYFGYSSVTSNELGLGLAAGGFVSGGAFDAAPFFESPDSGEYVVEFGGAVRIQVRPTPGVPLQQTGYFDKIDIKFQYRLNANPDSPLYNLEHHNYSVGVVGYNHVFTIPPQSFTHQLQPGDKLYLYAEVYTHEITESGGQYNFQLDATERAGTYLRIRASTKTEPTPADGLLVYEAFDRLAQALTDEPDAFRSEFFGRTDTRRPQPTDGPGAGQLVTGGFQLRGFPLPSAPPPAAGAPDPRKSLYATWRELFDSESAIFWLGYGIEPAPETGKPIIRVEPAPYFYPREVVLDLTVSTPARPAPAVEVETDVEADRHFQTLEFGYAEWQPQQVNGLDEANTKRQWTTPLTQVATAYSQISKYATSGQLLELTRRQRYADSDTTDAGNDTTNFLISLLRRPDGGFETERNQLFTRLEGVLDPASIYNPRYSPGRMLRRHGAAVRAGLEPAGTRRIRLAKGEGNNALLSQLVGEAAPVAESADILVSELAAPLWRPEADVLKELPVTRDQVQALLANPRGRVRYYDAQGAVCEGWILDFKHQATEQLGDFTLLPCAD